MFLFWKWKEGEGRERREGLCVESLKPGMGSEEEKGEFYLRYYVGHKGKFGHEFLEFEFRPDGKLRYANNSNYKNDTIIRKEVYLTPAVLRECRRIISDSEVSFHPYSLLPRPFINLYIIYLNIYLYAA